MSSAGHVSQDLGSPSCNSAGLTIAQKMLTHNTGEGEMQGQRFLWDFLPVGNRGQKQEPISFIRADM